MLLCYTPPIVRLIDDMVAGIAAAVDDLGIADNTYIMFTSDHGAHMRSHADRDETYLN